MANDCAKRLLEFCIANFTYASQYCAKTCRICSTQDPNPATIAKHKRGVVHRIFATPTTPQVIEGPSSIDTWLHLRQVEDYMYNQVYADKDQVFPNDVRRNCQLRHELCTFWAASGECENNQRYMRTMCAPACFSCLDLVFEHRCPLDQSGPAALSQPGDLYALFERLLTDPQFAPYNPQALSRPDNATVDTAPWVIVMDDVLTEDECDALIAQGAARGYKPSSEVGHQQRFDGKRESMRSERRTSSTTWCKGDCAAHPVAVSVLDRIQALTGITQQNYEPLQLLKYV